MKTNISLILIFISIIVYAGVEFENGHVGLTRLNGVGCQCHGLEFNDSVHVWIEGPDSIIVNESALYKLLMTGGPAVAGGFNVATIYGRVDSTDTLSHRMVFIEGLPLELTHTMPNNFVNDTVSWNFKYTAPDSVLTDTIYSVANSVDGDGIPFGDEWNFGDNFPVRIVDNPVNVEDIVRPVDYYLAQNFPNPFNPNTTIRFTIYDLQFTILKVYDVTGTEVGTLVNEEKPAGTYDVTFDATALSSGIYFYQLKAGSFVQIKKMLLLK